MNRKIADLRHYLVDLNLVAVEQIDSFVDEPKIIPSGQIISNGIEQSIVLYEYEYEASFFIERYPFKRHPPERLFGHVSAWLIVNDGDREQIATPTINVDVNDDSTADIEITISFREDVTAIEDAEGEFLIGSKRYRLEDALIDTAETWQLFQDIKT
jgi:hypothetical protein